MMQMKNHLKLFPLLVAGLLAGCSADEEADGIDTSQDEIRLTVSNDWQYGNITRAATVYDHAHFPSLFWVKAYVKGTWTEYLDALVINETYNGWVFDGFQKYYWPMVAELNFFAYMPANTANSVVPSSDVSCTQADGPKFSVTLPATSGGQDGKDEWIYAYEQGKSKAANASGVDLNFKHPLSTFIFRLSKLHEGMTIKNITVKNVKTSGTFTHSATPQWSNQGNETDFVATVNSKFELPASEFPKEISGPYFGIPQTFAGGKQTVIVSFDDNGFEDTMEAEVDVPEWKSGTRYLYDLTINTYLKVNVVTISINPWKKYDW
jgi:hypothetical protein